jgi:predicted transposase/invertase (TIGR01784 family)
VLDFQTLVCSQDCSFFTSYKNLFFGGRTMKESRNSLVLDNDDPLDIRKDNVFKAVFAKGTPESTGALSKLVSALIGRDVTIVSLLANEPEVGNVRDRQIRFDINCRAENGELVNVEMCLNPDASEPVRLEFHAAKLFVGQDIRGSNRSYKDLQQAYQIAILAKEKYFGDETFYHSFKYYDETNKVSLNGRTQIITLELSKLDKIVEKSASDMSVSERWAVFFEYLTDRSKRSKINEILKTEEGIAMAGSVLIKVSKDEEERARIMRDEKIELDYQHYMVTAKREGIEIGIEEGIEIGEKRGEQRGEQKIINLLKSGKSPEEIIRDYSGET